MTDIATLQAQLADLKRNYRSGVARANYDGKSVEFKDGPSMLAAIASLENEINGPSAQPRTVTVRSTKGW